MTSSLFSARASYLQRLAQRYGHIALPFIGQQQTVPLQTIYKPLTLISDPLVLQPFSSKKQGSFSFKAADDALGEILSVEQGIEDD